MKRTSSNISHDFTGDITPDHQKSREQLVLELEQLRRTIASTETFKSTRKHTKDITRYQQSEKSLRLSEEKYQSLFSAMMEGFAYHQVILDDQGTPIDYIFLDINDSFEKLTGLKSSDILGKRVTEALPDIEKDPANWIELYGSVSLGGEPVNFEQYSQALDRWYSVFAYSPSPLHFVALFHDITERKQAEEAQRESDEHFKNLVSNIPGALYIGEADWTITYTSPMFEAITGYPASDIVNNQKIAYASIVQPDDIQYIEDGISNASMEKQSNFILEYRIIRKDGDIRWVSDRVRTLIGEDGQENGFEGLLIDITNRRQAEEALKEREAFNYALFQHNPIATIVVDNEGKVTKRNLAQKRSSSRDPDIGDIMYRDFAGNHEIDMYARLMECIETGQPIEFPEMKYGKQFLSITIAPFKQGAIIISKDITNRKRNEDKAARVIVLEEVDHLRKALLASVSHELRTPLASIKGLAETLIQTDVKWDRETEMDFLKTINQEADRLTHIVSDLMQMSKLESGMMKISKVPSIMSALMLHVGNQLKTLTENHEFMIDVPRNLPPIMVDEIRIGEVITNLVSNAVAYSKQGTTISIKAHLRDDEVVVMVSDHGIGIQPEHLEMIFDRFHRLENGIPRKRGGSGLGLAICKGIIEMHGGKIWAESSPNEGSTISFTLPVAEDEIMPD